MIALLLVKENEYYGAGVVHRPLDNHKDNTDDETIAMTTLSVISKKKNIKILNLNDDNDGENNEKQIQVEQYQPPRIAIAPRRTSSVVSFIDDFTIDDEDDNDDDDDDEGDSSSQGSAAVSSTATTQCHEILNLDDYTEQEKQNCWYTRRGYFEIRDRVKLELSLYLLDKNTNDGVVADDDEYCVRGLERRIHTAKTMRHTTRSQAVHAVLYEMKCQKHNGYTNQNMVADVYREYSIPSATIAQTIAHQDKMDANPR